MSPALAVGLWGTLRFPFCPPSVLTFPPFCALIQALGRNHWEVGPTSEARGNPGFPFALRFTCDNLRHNPPTLHTLIGELPQDEG